MKRKFLSCTSKSSRKILIPLDEIKYIFEGEGDYEGIRIIRLKNEEKFWPVKETFDELRRQTYGRLEKIRSICHLD